MGRTALIGLITRRSKVQILPPPPRAVLVSKAHIKSVLESPGSEPDSGLFVDCSTFGPSERSSPFGIASNRPLGAMPAVLDESPGAPKSPAGQPGRSA